MAAALVNSILRNVISFVVCGIGVQTIKRKKR